ncbi:hypothetical protein AURDEDRAFT_114219, partial [Auricularia subglabra TFB-10046 SS5]
MAPPALYIVGGVVVAAGAVIAFKELVYDPYIHPRVEAFFARRDARRLARAHVAEAQMLVEPREVAYAVRQQRRAPIEMSDVRRRPRWADASPASGRSSSPLPPRQPSVTRPVAPFGLQTPQESPAPLVDLAPAPGDPFADPPLPPVLVPRRTGSSPTEQESTVPSLLRSPPPARSPPVVHDEDDDDDLVLSFISDRLRARRSGASSPDLIRLAPPSQSPRLTSETFVPPAPRSPSQRTLSSSSSRALSPFDEDVLHGALAQDAPQTFDLRRSVLSPIPSSSLTAARPPSYDSRPVSPWSELDDFEHASQARSPRSAAHSAHDFDTLSSHTLSEFDFGTTTDSENGIGADDELSSPGVRVPAQTRTAADFDVRSVSSNEL